jgi:hypothetical protein
MLRASKKNPGLKLADVQPDKIAVLDYYVVMAPVPDARTAGGVRAVDLVAVEINHYPVSTNDESVSAAVCEIVLEHGDFGQHVAAACALIASSAARSLCTSQFEDWGLPFVGHRAEVLNTGPRGPDFSPVDDWMTIRVDPPGITKTVRYAYPREGDQNTRCMVRSGAVIPIHTYFPVESHGDHVYPSWLWPGSVVDELYELSVELADAFDWPGGSKGNLTGTRPRSESAAWFVLTGEAPQVRPIDARWEQKHGSRRLSPQWRIHLTIPPWLPEEEVMQAFRTLRRQRPNGRQMPKTAKPLEVARFVWERERRDGYREPASWTEWVKEWNDKHPGHRFETASPASHFRTYFFRGSAAVTHLNFDWPNFEHPRRHSDTI